MMRDCHQRPPPEQCRSAYQRRTVRLLHWLATISNAMNCASLASPLNAVWRRVVISSVGDRIQPTRSASPASVARLYSSVLYLESISTCGEPPFQPCTGCGSAMRLKLNIVIKRTGNGFCWPVHDEAIQTGAGGFSTSASSASSLHGRSLVKLQL